MTGSSGSGRTHLLAWLATGCPSDNPRTGRRVHACLPAAGLTVHSATWLLADRLGVAARTPAELATALHDGRPRVLVVTDLDQAGGGLSPEEPQLIAAELLAPLLAVPGLRLAVESTEGTAAAAVLAGATPEAAVLDLDDPRWTDPRRFADWCARLPGTPPDAAQVHPSPGLAQLAARLGGAGELDAAAPIAVRLRQMCAAWWKALPEELRPAVRALGVAERPILAEDWAALPGSGGADAVHRATALLPPHADQFSWRLHLEPLRAQVAADSPPVDDAELVREFVSRVPRTEAGQPDFPRSSPDMLGILLRHGVRAGLSGHFLSDPEFLVHADPGAVTAAFECAGIAGDALALAWQQAGPALTVLPSPAERAAVLRAWLTGRAPEACARLDALVPGPAWSTIWVHRPTTGAVRALTVGRGPYEDRIVAVTDGGVHVLDPDSGLDSGASLPRLPVVPTSLACGYDGVLLAVDRAGTMACLPSPVPDKLDRPATVAGYAAQHVGSELTTIAALPNRTSQALFTGDAKGGLRLFLNPFGNGMADSLPRYDAPVLAIGVADHRFGAFIVSGDADGRVWAYELGRPPAEDLFGRPLTEEPIDARDCPVTALAATETQQGIVMVAAWADGVVRLRRQDSADTVLDLRLGSPVRSAAVDRTGRVFLAVPEGVFALQLRWRP
ncbi:hypothetical protein [Kitasatospora sp. GP82]|uniref:hypothetical protein n=1 Tax=Kitasatospora sp. GP82 TaxID=3035089 RepID=UPI00247342C5|nr:hypothetical protein [Kitasatospora sp. GP82]